MYVYTPTIYCAQEFLFMGSSLGNDFTTTLLHYLNFHTIVLHSYDTAARRNFLFMGSSLGNYDDKEAVELLRLIGRNFFYFG